MLFASHVSILYEFDLVNVKPIGNKKIHSTGQRMIITGKMLSFVCSRLYVCMFMCMFTAYQIVCSQ